MRKCAAVPVASALVSDHVPDFAFDPLDAPAIQSEGRLRVANTVPVSEAEQSAGAAPVRIFMTALVLITVSMESSLPFLTATDNWSDIGYFPFAVRL